MASKFQNRLVGTIVLVALGVIVLPGLLDGQKKHYQDEFAAIPLVPKPGDRDEPDMMPAATQALPTQPPEGAAEEVRAGDAAAPSLGRRAWRLTMSSLIRYRWRRLNRSRLKSRSRSLNRNSRLSPLPRRRPRRNQSPTINLRRPAKPMSYSWAR